MFYRLRAGPWDNFAKIFFKHVLACTNKVCCGVFQRFISNWLTHFDFLEIEICSNDRRSTHIGRIHS